MAYTIRLTAAAQQALSALPEEVSRALMRQLGLVAIYSENPGAELAAGRQELEVHGARCTYEIVPAAAEIVVDSVRRS